MTRGNRQEVVGVMHLIGKVDGNNLKATVFDIIDEWQILFPQRISLGAWLAHPEVAGVVLWCTGLGFQSAAQHRTEIAVDDVEVGIEVHLHLPQLVVAHYYDGVVAEGVGLQHLFDALIVGTHAAADERDVACRNIVATLQSAVTFDTEDGFHAEVVVAEFNDVGFRGALTAVHVADDMSSWRGDALVAGEVEVHQRCL